ncbi:hypothetical protein ACIHIX_40655 [Streptomyces sp. NPDC051913]|uniref:hypothetical protein n=1 Tax=Streptomyces sp. NPDC051913 TaxID=3365676 RepID=UPI0037D2B5AF
MNPTNNTGGPWGPSNAQMAPFPTQGPTPEHSVDMPAERPPAEARKSRPSWNVETPSAETAAIVAIAMAEAANLAGFVDGPVAGGTMATGAIVFLAKKCIKRNR